MPRGWPSWRAATRRRGSRSSASTPTSRTPRRRWRGSPRSTTCRSRFLKDVGNELADRLGVERTPEVFVLDADRVVRYRGRVDDQFGFGVHRPAPTRRDLAAALDDLLAGRPVATPRTEPVGCRIGRVAKARRRRDGHLLEAGRPDPPRPLRRLPPRGRDRPVLAELRTSRPPAGPSMIDEVVQGGRMPPWHASPEYGTFSNDARLSAEEKRTIAAWVAAGAPEGDPRDLPEPAQYVEGWRIPAPDLVIALPKTVKIPAEGTMPYQNFMVDPKLKKDVWVRASQVRPGNPSVVHHLVVFVIPPGSRDAEPKIDFLAAYAPGMPPRILPEGTAKLVPAGSRLMFQVHYTPRGIAADRPQRDRPGLRRPQDDPQGDDRDRRHQHGPDASRPAPPTTRPRPSIASTRTRSLYSLLPHMHLRGKSFRFEAVYPDGRREVLLDVPRYEFEWQNVYVLSEPKLMPEGSVLRCLARYDNSAGNPSNPDPKRDGHLGRADARRDARRLRRGRAGRPGPGPGRADEPEARRRPLRGDVPLPSPGRHQGGLPGRHLQRLEARRAEDGRPRRLGPVRDEADPRRREYEYKYVLDGKAWRHDPGNRLQAGGYHNSVLKVAKALEDRRSTAALPVASVLQEPRVKLRVVVGRGPRVVAGIRVNRDFGLAAGLLERFDHRLGGATGTVRSSAPWNAQTATFLSSLARDGLPPPQIGAIAANRSGYVHPSSHVPNPPMLKPVR